MEHWDFQALEAFDRTALEELGKFLGEVDNQAYARAFVETARRAVLRCAPLELPDDLYSYWREFELNFDPRLMT